MAFLLAAVADALLGVIPLTLRVALLGRTRELRDGRCRRQLHAFADGRRRRLAEHLGLVGS